MLHWLQLNPVKSHLETSLNPIRFGSSGRELAGIFHPASGETPSPGCVVFCNPFGQEAIRCHRMFRILADRLARQGLHVLTFDYFGTGDSCGMDDDGEIDGWIDDALCAQDELARLSGSHLSSLFGLRLGGSIAALATARNAKALDHLVIWDPVLSGENYLAELAHAHIAAAKAGYGARWDIEKSLRENAAAEVDTEAMGFHLSVTLRKQLKLLSPASFCNVRAGKTIAYWSSVSGNISPEELASARFAFGATEICNELMNVTIKWTTNEALNSAVVPAEAIRKITAQYADFQ